MNSDTAALQAALAAGGTIYLDARTYSIDAPLVVSVGVDIIGQRGTVLQCVAPMDALLTINAQCNMEKLELDGSAAQYGAERLARDVVVCRVAATSEWRRVAIGGGYRDGVHLLAGADTNNDGIRADMCQFNWNGWHYGSSASTAAFMSKPAPPTTLVAGKLMVTPPPEARRGCLVSIGGVPYTVESVAADGLVLRPRPAGGTHPGLPGDMTVPTWTLGIGCGWYEERGSDNNIATISHALFRGNAEVGASFNGLYGPLMLNPQFDSNGFYGCRVGLDGNNPVFTASFVKPYFEGHPYGSFLWGGAQGVDVRAALHGNGPGESCTLGGVTYSEPAAQPGFAMTSPVLSWPTINGVPTMAMQELNQSNWTLHGTNVTTAPFVSLNPNGAGNVTFDGQPVFQHPRGPLTIQCAFGQPYSVTLKGFLHNYWSPTGIQTKAGGDRTLAPGEVGVFWSDGVKVWEVA